METNPQFLDEISRTILMLLIKHPEGLSFSDIVRLTGKPRETINRRLKSLVESLIVEKIYQGKGRKTIYRIKKRNLEALLIEDFLPKVFFRDILKGFSDLFSMDQDDNSYAFLCKFANSYPYFLLGSLSSVFKILIDIANKLIEKQKISEKELVDRLYKVGIFITGSGFVLDKPAIWASAVTIANLVKEERIKKIDDKRLLEICSDNKKTERLYHEGLKILVEKEKEYAKRLLELERLMIETDSWKALEKIYREITKDYVERFLSFYSIQIK